MSARSFTVFLDKPQPEITNPKAANVADLPLSLSQYNNNAPAIAAKENLDPVTGERTGSSTTATNKKRKNSTVLATKVHNPPTAKKQKESSLKSIPDVKKRKSSTSKPKSTSTDKDTKRSGSGKKLSTSSRSSSARKVSPMPRLDEEGNALLERERERIRQAEIDSRCYELTVLPLADVTRAYDTAPSTEYPLTGGKPVLSRSIKESSSEPELCDYYSPSLSSSTSLPSLTSSLSSFTSSAYSKRAISTPPNVSQESLTETRIFTTPERKHIYATFTFTSPSPTSERLVLTRSTSVDAIQFNKDI